MTLRTLLTAFIISTFPALASAEFELSFYGGGQSSPHSGVTISGDSVVPDNSFTAGWEGRPFVMPPYYGVRATWWRSETFGLGLDVNHVKAYANADTLDETGYEHFEFSDGLNVITLNAYRRWPGAFDKVTPYAGGGVGFAMPHVELIYEDSRTWGYQVTGPAVAWFAGIDYPINDRWSAFFEYKGTYSMNTARLDTGGTLKTNIITNALNLGISYGF